MRHRKDCILKHLVALGTVLAISMAGVGITGAGPQQAAAPTLYKTVTVEGLDIFYREAGLETAPTILLLHSFPTSSQMFRNLIPALSDTFHLVAPDYPGFGHSAMPTVESCNYTFDHLADVIDGFVQQLGLTKYSLYVMDYGSNPPKYPQWQAYFRKYQPPTLVVWGKNDHIFPAEGAPPISAI